MDASPPSTCSPTMKPFSQHTPATAIGVRTVLREWTTLRGTLLNTVALVFAAVLIVLGARAVVAVVLPGGIAA